MTTHAQFYLTRAAVARELADGCKLDNVRESHLRAAEAWDGFAARAMKADLMRAEELKENRPRPIRIRQKFRHWSLKIRRSGAIPRNSREIARSRRFLSPILQQNS